MVVEGVCCVCVRACVCAHVRGRVSACVCVDVCGVISSNYIKTNVK